MFMEYLGGPGLVRAYSLELLAETLRQNRAQRHENRHLDAAPHSHGIWRAIGRLIAGLRDRLAGRRVKPAAAGFCR